jgi:hypothetical protein
MPRNQEEINLLDAIYSEFPEVGEDLDRTLKDHWDYEPHEKHEMCTGLVERFSQLTTDAISEGNEKVARKHLQFMESQFLSGGENCREMIDVYYVESLLWNISNPEKKRWGWSLIPKPLQELYIKLWGPREFMS